MQLGWAVVALAACGGKSPPSGASGPGSPVVKSSGEACITPPEEAAAIRNASATVTRVSYCIGTEARCFALDVSTGAFERTTAPKPPAPPPANPDVEVKLLGDARAGKGYAEVWNAGKRAATIRYARGDFRCGEAAMLDDSTLYMNAVQCGQPSARAGLYRLDGRKIANVGGNDFGTYGGKYLHVEGTTWAFLEENGSQVVFQDIAKGKVLKTVDTSLLFGSGGAAMGNPGESALVRFADGKLGVIAGAPAFGSVATIDTTSGEIAIVAAPICGQPR